MMPNLRLFIALWTALMAFGGPAALAAEDPADGEIRNLKLGMAADQLPAVGYTGFACAAAPERMLAGWAEFRACPPDTAGLYEVRFEFDQSDNPLSRINDRWEGTKVAGHPVLLSLLFGEDGVVEAIRVVTDPRARLYYKKKAFLLALRIKERYGAEGWRCVDQAREPGEAEVGGMYIKRRCEKADSVRRLILETSLYRKPGQTGRAFEDATRLEILRVKS